VGEHPSASLSLLANLEKKDVSRAVTLAHDNLVTILWTALVRANKVRRRRANLQMQSHTVERRSAGLSGASRPYQWAESY